MQTSSKEITLQLLIGLTLCGTIVASALLVSRVSTKIQEATKVETVVSELLPEPTPTPSPEEEAAAAEQAAREWAAKAHAEAENVVPTPEQLEFAQKAHREELDEVAIVETADAPQ